MVFKVKVTKLQGYKLYWIFSILEWKGYKVTKVTEDTHMFFSKIKLFLWGYEVTRLRRLQGYEIAKSSTYLATTVNLSYQSSLLKHPTRRQNFANTLKPHCAHYLTLRRMVSALWQAENHHRWFLTSWCPVSQTHIHQASSMTTRVRRRNTDSIEKQEDLWNFI